MFFAGHNMVMTTGIYRLSKEDLVKWLKMSARNQHLKPRKGQTI